MDTEFKELDAVDFTVKPQLGIRRDPDNEENGVAVASLLFTSLASETRPSVHAAVWLPKDLTKFSVPITGTNLYPGMWEHDLTPEQPSFGLHKIIRFSEFSNYKEIVAAFAESTRVRILWEGGEVFFTFPGDLWEIEIVD